MVRRFSLFSLTFASLAFVIIACQGLGGGQTSKPTVIIASPPSGSVYSVGEEVFVQSTATDPSGVTQVTLLVDGAIVRQDPSPVAQGQAQFSLIQSWVSTGVGQHNLTVRATNSQGATSDSGIIVNVKEQTAQQPTPVVSIATAVPLATLAPATEVPPPPIPTNAEATAIPPVTVLVVTATSSPATDVPSAPTATTAPTCVINSKFVADLTIPDGTIFTPNAVFTKSWRVLNNGTCDWNNFSLIFVSGTQMSAGGIYPVPNTPPGATADLTVPMNAPGNYGTYSGVWRLRNAAGQVFGTNLTVVINVPSPATAVPPTPTPPPTVAGCSGKPNNFTFTASPANINAGQSVTLSWGAVTNASEVRLDGGEFSDEGVAAPGSRTISPNTTTQYTLKAICSNSGQTNSSSVTVTVGAAVSNFAGNWVHNFGTMNLAQAGPNVNGSFVSWLGVDGQLQGTVSGNVLTGTYVLGGSNGSFSFTMGGNNKTFNGNGSDYNQWCGARTGEKFPNGCAFAGSWVTKYPTNNSCSMSLTQTGTHVTGTYCNGSVVGDITYTIGAVHLNGMWNATGSFDFYLPLFTSSKFTGHYDTSLEWCGWRNGQSAPNPCEE